MLAPAALEAIEVGSVIGHDVPFLIFGKVEGDNARALLLGMEGHDAVGRANIEKAQAGEVDAAEIGVDVGTQVPFALDHAVPGNVHRVVEVTVLQTLDLARFAEGSSHDASLNIR